MVFVTVGNPTQGFLRLLESVDALAGRGFFASDQVVIQKGNNPGFQATHCKHQAFFTADQFLDMINEASVVICHAGAGTLIHVLKTGKAPVVMPRQKRFGEHIDDHQVELTRALASEGRIIPAYESDSLPAAIEAAQRRLNRPTVQAGRRMIDLVVSAIADLTSEKL